MRVVTDHIIAETSSKGNQEKWLENGRWYKLDQFGYEALAETVISKLLEKCRFDSKFSFVKYDIEKIIVHNRPRIACVSNNFLKDRNSIITLNKLISNEIGEPLVKRLAPISSNIKRLEYMVDTVSGITGLKSFGEYLTLIFEIDTLFLNEDRHLNNIAVLYDGSGFEYCPIFDNGAGLLSDVRSYGYDIAPQGLYPLVKAQPFGMSFTRQANAMRKLYGRQLKTAFDMNDVDYVLDEAVTFYPERDRGLIRDRVRYCIKKGHS